MRRTSAGARAGGVARLLDAATQLHTVKSDAVQLRDKLVETETLNRSLMAQAVKIEGDRAILASRLADVEARVKELAGARSRRLLLKFGLVSRCQWEK